MGAALIQASEQAGPARHRRIVHKTARRGWRRALPSSGRHEAHMAIPYRARSKITGTGTPWAALPVIGGFGSELSPGSTTNL
jgi:hypothetical protein